MGMTVLVMLTASLSAADDTRRLPLVPYPQTVTLQKSDKDVIVCPFDIKHADIMPKDYFNAGYTVLNTSWTPLYITDRLYMTTPEILAKWSPKSK